MTLTQLLARATDAIQKYALKQRRDISVTYKAYLELDFDGGALLTFAKLTYCPAGFQYFERLLSARVDRQGNLIQLVPPMTGPKPERYVRVDPVLTELILRDVFSDGPKPIKKGPIKRAHGVRDKRPVE